MRRGERRGGYRGGSGYRSPEGFRGALREVWLSPGRFFRELDPGGGPIRPALFASTVLYLNLIFEALLQAIWLRELSYALLYAPLLGLVVSLVLAPLLVAGLAALVIFVLQGAPSLRGFGPLFRSLGYAAGIGAVLWIPYAPLIALPYGAYVATVAVKTTLNLSWRRASIATLVPLGALLLILLLLAGTTESYELFVNPPGS